MQLKHKHGEQFPFKAMNIPDDVISSSVDHIIKEQQMPNGKHMQLYSSGKRIIKGNSDIRVRLPSNEMIAIFNNGDVKKVCKQ